MKKGLTNKGNRGKFISVVLQPKIDSEFFASNPTDKKINEALMESSFPLHTELIYSFDKIIGVSSAKQEIKNINDWAFGTETSESTNIPHYQIFLEFPCVVSRMSVYKSIEEYYGERAHIATSVAYNENYRLYCTKNSSNFEFESSYYWNVKKDKSGNDLFTNEMLILRPKLKMIEKTPFTGQKLMLSIVKSNPDDRTLIWIADLIGGSGKTTALQSVITNKNYNLIYLRISEGLERLSSKLRKKIKGRLDKKLGYPNSIWLNFGRTVSENSLKTFADFGEQILDGMLDDNFGNTATDDFVALPYVNLIVTANTPPNLRQLTSDRIKLLTLFPIYNENDKLIDSLLIPIYAEIRVRFIKAFPYDFEYKYVINVSEEKYYENDFKEFSWYPELLENIEAFKEYERKLTDNSKPLKFRMSSDWLPGKQNTVQDDINLVHRKALSFSTTVRCEDSKEMYIEASSHKNVHPRYYRYGDTSKYISEPLENDDKPTDYENPIGDELKRLLEEDRDK